MILYGTKTCCFKQNRILLAASHEDTIHIMSTPSPRIPLAGLSHRAFTLIELLAVVAIVALLAAILVPTISNSIASANMSADLGKLKTISLAVTQYTSEQGAYPRTHDSILINAEGSLLTGLGWEAIDRYMSPMPGFNPKTQGNFWSGPGKGGGRDCWYAKSAKQPLGTTTMHMPFALNPLAVNTVVSNLWTDIPNRSRLVLMTETNTRSAGGGLNGLLPVTYKSNETTGVTGGYRASHPGKRALFLFCDFHIEAVEGDQSMNNPNRKVSWSRDDIVTAIP